MNYDSTMAMNETMNERMQTKSSIPFRTRAKSMLSQKSSPSYATKEEIEQNQSKGISVFDKIKKVFSSRTNNGAASLQILSNQGKNEKMMMTQGNGTTISKERTQLRTNIPNIPEDFNDMGLKNNPDVMKDHCIEWQPVFHETCQIKLPVEDTPKIKMPEEAIDEWIQNNSKVYKNRPNLNENNKKIAEGKTNDSQNSCSVNTKLSQSSCMGTNKDEPYAKFKYYYNYYLVDEYLDSLAESENKKRDMSGLNEEGELYDNLNLNVKPILTTKERLESGVPYDPKNLLM